MKRTRRISIFGLGPVGWRGSCFPKDVKALISYSNNIGYNPSLVKAILKSNKWQSHHAIVLAEHALGPLKNKRNAILGLAFKPNTNDIREAVTLKIVNELKCRKAEVCVYDPVANKNARRILGNSVRFAKSASECVRGTDCCIIATEWDEFRRLKPRDFANMRRQLLIDGRRLYDPNEFSKSVEYYAIGLGPTIGK